VLRVVNRLFPFFWEGVFTTGNLVAIVFVQFAHGAIRARGLPRVALMDLRVRVINDA
jgi:hypothetical protein